jgi:hypothetical protein
MQRLVKIGGRHLMIKQQVSEMLTNIIENTPILQSVTLDTPKEKIKL